MNAPGGWQTVRHEVLRRIHAREWKPGELIPNEVDLAEEFRCARATVNRALRALADAGLLDRRRRAGTRVARYPARRATLRIPVLREEIEQSGRRYRCALLNRRRCAPSAALAKKLALPPGADMLRLRALHLADERPYALERRWIHLGAVPEAAEVDFSRQSANEWLVMHAPFTRGDIAFGAVAASARDATLLETEPGEALFLLDRVTWNGAIAITSVRLSFAPGYRMRTEI